MLARKISWLAAEISFAALWVRFGSGAALALALALLLIPLVSIPMNLYMRKKLHLKLTAEVNLSKGFDTEVLLELDNPTHFPVSLIPVLTAENLLNGMFVQEKLHFSGDQITRSIQSQYCGRLRIAVEKARLYDCFGLIGIPLNSREACHITVLPDGFETNISLTDYMGDLAESELYSQFRAGSDLTETFQLREYIPGDSPRQIHWKLSGKLDRLIVRDPGLPIVQDVLLFWERTVPEETPASIDAQVEVIVSIGRACLQQDVQFRLGWNDTKENRCILHEIRELDDLIAVLPRLLSARGSVECDSGAALLMQTRPEALCRHMVYVANAPAPEVQDWHSYGRLTILTPDETNYAAQLAVLAL